MPNDSIDPNSPADLIQEKPLKKQGLSDKAIDFIAGRLFELPRRKSKEVVLAKLSDKKTNRRN
jgi:hypothetical protein